jgi:hypothetical protein
MERISKKDIERLVVEVGKKYHIPTKPEWIKNRKPEGNLTRRDYLNADHNSIYGGWILMKVDKKHGGESYFDPRMSYRIPTGQFYNYLKGLLR